MTLIGLISDVHAMPEPLEQALSIFSHAGVSRILCAGDVAGYYENLPETIKLLKDNNCKTVVGNHDLQYLQQHEDTKENAESSFLKQLPATFETVIDGKRLYMVHAQPPDGCHGGIKLRGKDGIVMPDRVRHWSRVLQPYMYDVLVVGHTHQVFVEKMANMLVINPGSTAFNHCCAILQLPEMTVELFALSGKKIEPTWNWGEYMIYGKKP
jgi:predicted phosphodiesterase